MSYTIGEMLKDARLDVPLTQREVGEMIGVTNYAISKIENNKIHNDNTIKKILAALNVYTYDIKSYKVEESVDGIDDDELDSIINDEE